MLKLQLLLTLQIEVGLRPGRLQSEQIAGDQSGFLPHCME